MKENPQEFIIGLICILVFISIVHLILVIKWELRKRQLKRIFGRYWNLIQMPKNKASLVRYYPFYILSIEELDEFFKNNDFYYKEYFFKKEVSCLTDFLNDISKNKMFFQKYQWILTKIIEGSENYYPVWLLEHKKLENHVVVKLTVMTKEVMKKKLKQKRKILEQLNTDHECRNPFETDFDYEYHLDLVSFITKEIETMEKILREKFA